MDLGNSIPPHRVQLLTRKPSPDACCQLANHKFGVIVILVIGSRSSGRRTTGGSKSLNWC